MLTTNGVTELGYLGLEVNDVTAWRSFATEVLGLEATDGSGDDVELRMDDRPHRITLHSGPRDDLAYAGWRVEDAAGLETIASRLESMGARVAPGTTDELFARGVDGLVRVVDPSGVALELYHRARVESERPFRSPRDIQGFVAGDLGLGHIVLAVDDYEDSLRFYRDGLGLRISDYIDLEMSPGIVARAAFFHAGPRHHSLAIVAIPATKRLHHFMLEVCDIDDVGSTYDLCQARGVPIVSSLGRHTNDRMVSFYAQTPSGFQVEYGFGGVTIDDATWPVEVYDAPSLWGHRPPA